VHSVRCGLRESAVGCRQLHGLRPRQVRPRDRLGRLSAVLGRFLHAGYGAGDVRTVRRRTLPERQRRERLYRLRPRQGRWIARGDHLHPVLCRSVAHHLCERSAMHRVHVLTAVPSSSLLQANTNPLTALSVSRATSARLRALLVHPPATLVSRVNSPRSKASPSAWSARSEARPRASTRVSVTSVRPVPLKPRAVSPAVIRVTSASTSRLLARRSVSPAASAQWRARRDSPTAAPVLPAVASRPPVKPSVCRATSASPTAFPDKRRAPSARSDGSQRSRDCRTA
jgi:hypothetical protein